MIRVVHLSPDGDLPPDVVGPKAVSLAGLMRAGLSVPPAFCVSAGAYREHAERNGLVPEIREALRAIETGSDPERTLSRLRARLVEPALDRQLENDIARGLEKLGDAPYAVRSSATAEDLPGHSFAGLHDTFLGVKDLASCLDAVKKCWASLWTHRALEYRRIHGFSHVETAMAVIVQALVRADASGVIFTANPLTGGSGCIIIEGCFGLGEALVSGKVTPDRFTFQRRGPRLVFALIAEKATACELGPDGTVREVSLEEARRKAPSVDNRVVKRLARSALRAEAVLGRPQDIEWARRGRRLHFLQSRPVTTPPRDLSWEERQVWTNLNLGEVAPDVLTPITKTFICRGLDRLFRSLVRAVGADLGDHPLAGAVAGRLYFNVNTGLGLLAHLPGSSRFDFESILGGAHADLYRSGRLDLAAESVPDLGSSIFRMALRSPRTLYELVAHRSKRARALLDRFEALGRRYGDVEVSGLSTNDLVDSLTELMGAVFAELDLLYVLTSLYAVPLVYDLARRWLDDPNGNLASHLFTGLGGMADAEAGLELWRLAHLAHKNADVAACLRAERPWADARKEITVLPGGSELLEAWDGFLREYGHHCRGEIEFYNRRWSEEPDYVLDLLRSHLSCLGATDPETRRMERVKERQRAVAECRRRLKNPLKRMLFNHFVRVAQRGCVLRENFKNEAVRLIAAGRRVLCELGRRLAENGTLGHPDDIFFLETTEWEPIARGRSPGGLAKTIRSRRDEYERFCSVTPPRVIVGRFDPERFTPDPVDLSVTTFRGISVSPGVVTGKARVILKTDADHHLEPGEILVAPFTDPGWTPYFLPAAAIVMDQGGILSHGSIVARELGIPAVVNVGPATRVIKTGQTITVDADRGVVLAHDA